VRIEAPDGTETFDQVPLTLEDVHFPEVGHFIVQTDGHDRDLGYLREVFTSQLACDSMAVVLSDCRVDWKLAGVRPLGPDVAVFSGVKAATQLVDLQPGGRGGSPGAGGRGDVARHVEE
jgi:hypothetical protein